MKGILIFLVILIGFVVLFANISADDQRIQDQAQFNQQMAQKEKENYLLKNDLKDSVPATQYQTDYIPVGDIDPSLALQKWIIAHPNDTIDALGTNPLQGGIGGFDVVFENKIPSFHYRVDSYSTIKEAISESKNRKIIAITTVNAWRGGIASEVVLSSPDYK